MTEDDLDRHARAAETKKRRTRERIIAATLNVFDPAATRIVPTLENIAEEAGVGIATLYSHFNTKYDLYITVFAQLFEPIVRPIATTTKLNTYKPDDLRAEIISYVCRVTILARAYRYFIAAYIQSFFENRQYDRLNGDRISQPLVNALAMMIATGSDAWVGRFRPRDIVQHLDNLLLCACMRYNDRGQPLTTRRIAIEVLSGLLFAVDQQFSHEELGEITAQVERIIPEDKPI